MNAYRSPYSGELLISHLAAFGLIAVLDWAGVRAWLLHDPDSLEYEPIIEFDADHADAAAAIRRSATDLETLVEADIEPNKKGNDRRPVIWARASYASDPSRATAVSARRKALAWSDEMRTHPLAHALLAGLGAPATWGGEKLKPSSGATKLDGVIGNNTSDLVRGVLRPARDAAAVIADEFTDATTVDPGGDDQLDKTGWAPPGTRITLAHQWLAVIGLSLLPVAHRPTGTSITPACWRRRRSRGVVLPLLGRPASRLRLRSILGLGALAELGPAEPSGEGGDEALAPATEQARLRSLGISELVHFSRRIKPGAGSSVAFTFERGIRTALR